MNLGEVMASPLVGMGGPIFLKSNVTNFELRGSLLIPDLFKQSFFAIGHTQVAIDFAHTAGQNAATYQPWGLSVSPLISGAPSRFAGAFWTQNSSGFFDKNYLAPLVNAAVDGLTIGVAVTAEGLKQTAEGVFQGIADGVRTDISVIKAVAQKTADVLTTATDAVVSGVNSVVQKAGDIASGFVHWIFGNAHSPVATSIQLAIPTNASLLGFDLSVTDKGNDDVLFVTIGTKVIGEVDLGAAMAMGGSSDMFWIGDYAGQVVTLNLVMPSTVPSSAQFTIGNLQFASIQSGYLGDANHDGSVSFADLVAVAQNYGASNKTWADGDFNGDGIISFADLVTVAQNYGTSLPAPTSAVAAVSAPSVTAPLKSTAPVKVKKPAPIRAVRPPAPIAPGMSLARSAPIFAASSSNRRRIAADVLR
jgi:hypothetical protein